MKTERLEKKLGPKLDRLVVTSSARYNKCLGGIIAFDNPKRSLPQTPHEPCRNEIGEVG